MISAYPLQWPAGWPRATSRKGARFSKGERQYSSTPGGSSWVRRRDLSISDGWSRVLAELERMGIMRDDVVISTNLPTRLDGLPRSDARKPADPGAAVYWIEPPGKRRVMAIDIYDDVAGNLAAIAATLEAMRAIERHGGARILERAFTGFAALPDPAAGKHWRDVLEYGAAPLERGEISMRYKLAAMKAHPDRGGSHEAMAALNAARDAALRECSA